MKVIALLSTVLWIAAGSEGMSATLTFDEAVALAVRSLGIPPSRPEIASLGRSRLPNVRAELMTNASRTLDLFAEGPIEVRSATSVIAFDYPIFGAGLGSARLTPGRQAYRGMDEGKFRQLLDAFGELFFVQKQTEVVRALSEELAAEANRSARLLGEGEISNLTAAERRDAAVAFASQLVELDARRNDALTRLRMLTGIEGEPTLVLDLSDRAAAPTGAIPGDDLVRATTIAVEEGQARLRAAGSANGLGMTLSGFVGIGAAASEFRQIHSDGSFGVYGLRVHLTYPLFGASRAAAIAEARANVEQSMASRQTAIDAANLRALEYRSREETSRKRIELLRQSVAAAKEKEESMKRLVSAGVRPETDLTYVHAERVRRESDLLATEIERWKATRLIARMTTAEPL